MAAQALCPVMNTEVDKKKARSQRMVRKFNGQEVFLCCKTCVSLFDKNPNQNKTSTE